MIINWLPSVWTPNQSLFSVKCEILDVELEEGRRSGKLTAISKQADSLYSLIADGQYRVTSLSRDAWKALIGSQAYLQYYCNKEGFNAVCSWSKHSKARIGIVGNKYDDCGACDSRIGFGTRGYPDDLNTCCNVAKWYPDNGDKYIKVVGCILVQ
ncbi:hypothetical protein pdam_00020541 [Pocillopora damicornis]|uniref:Uncharacterized protein n=1 Tax=Pocillopora damicornis TaxID=46731 RepID=A0A3M6T818_POCDA|nr:uncharacterized protein LOC113681259 [Pocillopora damicornis]RMX37540.1 hypothetical protein pdam_00020541 [Pocillopora damicornis]